MVAVDDEERPECGDLKKEPTTARRHVVILSNNVLCHA